MNEYIVGVNLYCKLLIFYKNLLVLEGWKWKVIYRGVDLMLGVVLLYVCEYIVSCVFVKV